MKTLVKNTTKILGATGVVCLLAWAFISMGDQPQNTPVPSALADLSFGSFAPFSKHEKFLRTLKKQGFEKPREYDWNGNKFFFTLKHTRDSPLEASRKLQRAFVENGVNKKAHTFSAPRIDLDAVFNTINHKPNTKSNQKTLALGKSISKHKTRLDDFFDGGIVPFTMEHGYVSMSGTKLKKKLKHGNSLSVVKTILNNLKNGQKFDEANVDRIYNIEAFRSNKSSKTTLTAVWSQKNLNLKKFGKHAKFKSNQEIPACIGCFQTMNFRSQGTEKGYANNVYLSPSLQPEDAHAFYKTTLGRRGWKRSDATKLLQKAMADGFMPNRGARIESYARGDKFLTVIAHPSLAKPNHTMIQILESR